MATPDDYLLALMSVKALTGRNYADPDTPFPKTPEEASHALAALAHRMWDEACAREQRGWRRVRNRIVFAWKRLVYSLEGACRIPTVSKATSVANMWSRVSGIIPAPKGPKH
jgi:hypothetical protein